MGNLKRRDFLRNCGIGLGLMMVPGLTKQNLKAGFLPEDIKNNPLEIFGLTKEEIKKLLDIALSKGGHFSELFFEYRINNGATMEEDIIKSTFESISKGVGIRVLNDDQTGFAFTNSLDFESIKNAALTAAAIAGTRGINRAADLTIRNPRIEVYPVKNFLEQPDDLSAKLILINHAYNAAKNYDSRIKKISSSLSDELQYVTIANSEGLIISDIRPQTRLGVVSTAEDNGLRGTGSYSAGGRISIDFYENKEKPEDIGKKASEEAIILLSAKNAPVGEQTVVLSKDQSGVMIHEAVGHPLEADGAWKKTSIMADRLGEMVANPIVTITDDATIPKYRGSLNIDDEGTDTENVVLIEKGRLVGFLNDKLAAQIMNQKPNGHGRRESYQSPPIPRMNNTILMKGDSTSEEIVKSVKKGFYAVSYQGGQVNSTGKFTFSVNLGYMIEDGKLTYPVKNATLIGTNLQILKDVDMIGNDTGFFLGTCGKEGQSVPVTAGTPTLRIKKMTVGGVA